MRPESTAADAFQRADEETTAEYLAGFFSGEREFVATLMRNARARLPGRDVAWVALALDGRAEREMGADALVIFLMPDRQHAKGLLLEAKRLDGAWEYRRRGAGEPSHFKDQLARQLRAAAWLDKQELFIRPRAGAPTGFYPRCSTLFKLHDALAAAPNAGDVWSRGDIEAMARRRGATLGHAVYDVASCRRGLPARVTHDRDSFRVEGIDIAMPYVPVPGAAWRHLQEGPEKSVLNEWMWRAELATVLVVALGGLLPVRGCSQDGEPCIKCLLGLCCGGYPSL